MKNWYFIAYYDREGKYVEWAIERVAPAFLSNTMDQYIKFSGSVVGGKAYRLSRVTGKPIFTKVEHQAGLPF